MNSAPPPPSSSRRLLACFGFVACWLGAAVTGFQFTVGDGPGEVLQVEPPAAGPAAPENDPEEGAPEASRAERAGGTRTAIREYWR